MSIYPLPVALAIRPLGYSVMWLTGIDKYLELAAR